MWWNIIPVLILPMVQGRMDCSKTEYDRCIRIADPLVKEPHLVFPDNINDIDEVCRTWNQFVDCLKLYTDACFTAQQRKQFNRAVESPIESVHQMCMQPSYQREYLRYAPCIKNTIIQNIHCGPQYSLLVDQVDQGDIISKSTLCCSQDRFKQCIQRETRRLCDRGAVDGPASRFAMQTIDKALSFLQDQCYNYIPNSGDCSSTSSDTLPYSDRSNPRAISTSSSEVYPWSIAQQERTQKEIFSPTPSSRAVTMSSSWLPSNSPPSGRSQATDSSTQMLGSRTRPASYGRASSWSQNAPQAAGNTVQMYPDLPSTPSTRPEWATVSAWDVRGQAPSGLSGTTRNTDNAYSFGTSSTRISPSVTTQQTWYPAAGSQLNNEVDEPNQLGLKKPKNTGVISRIAAISLVLSAIFLSIC